MPTPFAETPEPKPRMAWVAGEPERERDDRRGEQEHQRLRSLRVDRLQVQRPHEDGEGDGGPRFGDRRTQSPACADAGACANVISEEQTLREHERGAHRTNR